MSYVGSRRCGLGIDLGSATDTTGPNPATQRYFPWGAKRSTTELPTPYRFTGQREESKIGLYFYNARWYDPGLGRFIQPDPLVPEPGNPQALNRYAYTLNNPLKYTDPTGLFAQDEIMKYLGVQTWEEVLALFAKGGRFESNIGWLLVLQEAELGDEVAINLGHAEFVGRFEEEDGDLYLVGSQGKVLANDVGPAGSMYRLTRFGEVADGHGERATNVTWIERNAWKRAKLHGSLLEWWHLMDLALIGLFPGLLGATLIGTSIANPVELLVTGPVGAMLIVATFGIESLVWQEFQEKYWEPAN